MRRVSPSFFCIFACVTAIAAFGCEEAPTAALLDVETVGPARIDPGHRLVVRGAGFAVGHEVRIALIGALSRPFQRDEPIDEAFEAEAVNEEQVEMLVTETLLRERFGRATFHGRVEVRFDAHWDDRTGTISGALDEQRIDFVPSREAPVRGVSLASMLGVGFAESSDEGLAVESIDAGGRGSALGLAPGDRLVEIGGAHLVPGDAPRVPEDAGEASLTVLRDGRMSMLHLELGARDEEGASALVRLAQLALLIVWASLLGALPFARIDVAAASPPRALGRPTLALVARALAGLSLAHLAFSSLGQLPTVGLVIAAIVGLRAATTIAGSQRPLGQLVAIVVSSLALAVALAALPAVLDVSSIARLAEGGAASPREWPFFREPVGVLTLVLLALAVGIARPTRPLARTADDAWLLAIAVVAVLAGTGLAATDRVGSLALDVAAVVVAWLLGRAREHVRATPITMAVALALSVVVVVLASAWVIADPTAQLRQAFAEVSLAGAVITMAYALRAAIRDRLAPRPQHALL